MNIIKLNVSPSQLRKMKKALPVMIKKEMSGKGVYLVVNPSTYSDITNSFNANKSYKLTLSASEIDINRNIENIKKEDIESMPEELTQIANISQEEEMPEMVGDGIFGKKFDKWFKKNIMGRKKMKKMEKILKPVAKAAIRVLPVVGKTLGTMYGGPVAGAFGSEIGKELSSAGTEYIDNPQGKGLYAYSSRGRGVLNIHGHDNIINKEHQTFKPTDYNYITHNTLLGRGIISKGRGLYI